MSLGDAHADLSGSSIGAHAAGTDVNAQSRYKVGFPRVNLKSESYGPGLSGQLHSKDTARMSSLPRTLDSDESAGRKGKLKTRPRSMEFNVDSEADTLSDDGLSGKKRKKKKRGFIKRIKDFFHADSKSQPKAEISYGTSFEHPDDKEKSSVNTLSVQKEQPEMSLNLSSTSQCVNLSPTKTPTKSEKSPSNSKFISLGGGEIIVDVPSPLSGVSVKMPEKSYTISTTTEVTKMASSSKGGTVETTEKRTYSESRQMGDNNNVSLGISGSPSIQIDTKRSN